MSGDAPRAHTRHLVMFVPGISGGGAQRRGMLLARTFAERGWHVRVLSRSGTGFRFRLQIEPRITAFEVPGFSRRAIGAGLFALTALPLGLWWSRRATGIVSLQLSATTSVGAVCASMTRKPLVALSSTSGELSDAGHARRSGLRRLLLERVTWLVAQTDAGAEELATLGPADRITVVPNPVAQHTPPGHTGAPVALYSGRFSEEKDLPVLLEAWRIVKAEMPEAELLLAGSGGAYRSVEALLRQMVLEDSTLRATVTFTGWLEDVRSLFERADVFVFPSRSEGMSNSLLEACAAGRIVVASNIAANRAVVGDDYPLLFPVGDSDALAKALHRAFLDESIRRKAISQLSARLPRFSPAKVVERLESLLCDSSEH